MPYRCKPSKGCQECRKRKCDRRENGCANCERKRVRCSGYRDEVDLMFLHETERVNEKYGKYPLPFEENLGEDHDAPLRQDIQAELSKLAIGKLRTRFHHPSTEDFGLSYCYYWHVIRPEKASNATTIVRDPKLLCCMRALGMATLSTTVRSAAIESVARKYYVEALQLTSTALECKEEALRHSALLCVIILTLYECITGSIETIDNWSGHVRGAAALLQLRGSGQMRTAEGRFLYVQALMAIISSSWWLSNPIPEGIHRLTKELLANVDDSKNPYWRVLALKIQLIQLKAYVVRGRVSDPKTALQKAMQIDEDLKQTFAEVWMSGGPLDEKGPAGRPDTFPRQAPFLVQLRHSIHTGRIQCHLIMLAILEKYASHPPLTTLQFLTKRSQQIISQQSEEFLQRIPESLAASGKDPAETREDRQKASSLTPEKILPLMPLDYAHIANLALADLPVLRTVRGNVLLWQLAIVGVVARPGSEVRNTTCEVLKTFGETLGMSQAFSLVEHLQQDSGDLDPDKPWTSVLSSARPI